MEEMANLLVNNGTAVVIVLLFIWDWVANKKQVTETLKAISETSKNIEECLKNLEQNNENISKSLDLLQQSMDSQETKIDKILDYTKKVV